MTTVVQTTAYPQQNYPSQQNPAPTPYPPQQNAAPYPPTSYPPQPATTVIQVPATTTNTTNTESGSSKYNKNAGVVTGILQLIAAGILVLLGIIILTLQGIYFNIGWNIWGSICFYMVSGILGIASKNKNKCVIVAYMVMSILSAICAGSQMIYDIAASSTYSIISGDCSRNVFGDYDLDHYLYPYWDYTRCKHVDALTALHAVGALTAFAEMIIAIVASCYCCCGVCGTTTPAQTTVVTLTTQPAPGTTYPISSSPAYPPQGQFAQPPGYTTLPPQQQQQQQQQQPQQQAPAYEDVK